MPAILVREIGASDIAFFGDASQFRTHSLNDMPGTNLCRKVEFELESLPLRMILGNCLDH